MGFPIYRPRRTRATANLRSMIRENKLSVEDLIYPLFVVPGKNVKNEIESLPGNYHWSLDRLPEVLDEIVDLKIPAVILFGIPSYKNATGSSAWDMDSASLLIKTLPAAAPGIWKNPCSRPAA